MKTQLLLLFIITSAICYGQSTETDSVRLDRERKEQLLNNYKLSDGDRPVQKKSFMNNKLDKTDFSTHEKNETLDISVSLPSHYVGPASNYSAAPITNPYVDDYSFYGRNVVMDGGWINTASSHTTFPALGSLSIIRANYEYMLSDHIITSVGVYGAKYFYNLSFFEDFGVNASLKYQINDRFSIIGFGQYSARSNINGIGGDNAWMMPNTHYGVAGQYMFNNNFGVQGGVKRELNPMDGKWRNVPFILPVIRIR